MEGLETGDAEVKHINVYNKEDTLIQLTLEEEVLNDNEVNIRIYFIHVGFQLVLL